MSQLLARSAVLLFLASSAAAQLREVGTPASLRAPLAQEVPTKVLLVPDAAHARASRPVEESGAFRYGVELPVGLGLEDGGLWESVPATGELVWRLELASPGAFSLGVVFERFDLPPGGKVWLYDPGRTQVLGAYGESAENPNGVLAVQPLRGDRVVIEYVEPPGARARPELVVGGLVHDYVDVLGQLAPGGALAVACLVDVKCPQGAPYQDIKRAVIWMFQGGLGCSGSILNNTAEDGTPYMMTAEHCGDMTNGVFVFDYERSACGGGTSSQASTLSGSTRLAVSSIYDAQLYRLNQSIPVSYQPFFAGWSLRQTPRAPAIGISHPSGLPKKIQIDRQDPFDLGTRWNVFYEVGAIQPGSSGSPLFDRDERVIGTASTGGGGCSAGANYGRFDLFYTTRNLGTWLDPLGWGLTGIDGYDGAAPYTHRYNGGGFNGLVYTTVTEPRLGSTWTAQIDASERPGTTSTYLVGFGAPAESPLRHYGQLLVDVSSAFQFEHFASVVGGLSTHSFALPPSLSLAGRVSYTQAFQIGGGLEATNGLKLVLNF